MGLLLTKKGQEPSFELYEKEAASSHFAKTKSLVLTDPRFLTGNLLLSGLPFKEDGNTRAVLD